MEPRKTIPKAIIIALGITVVAYLVIITTALLTVDIDVFAQSKTPLTAAIESGRFSGLSPVVKFGACLASLGVLLSLLAGVSRTTFSMASNRDLPYFLSRVHEKHKVPHVAEVVIGLIVATIVAIADIRTAIGFSSFAILIYYAITNASAWTLSSSEHMWPKWMAGLGFLSCIVIAFSLPSTSIFGGLILFLVGSVSYGLSHKKAKV